MRARVVLLEKCRTSQSPIASAFGTFAAFEAHCDQLIAEGYLDPRDFPVVIMSLRRWESDGTWTAWSRNRIWEHGQRP